MLSSGWADDDDLYVHKTIMIISYQQSLAMERYSSYCNQTVIQIRSRWLLWDDPLFIWCCQREGCHYTTYDNCQFLNS